MLAKPESACILLTTYAPQTHIMHINQRVKACILQKKEGSFVTSCVLTAVLPWWRCSILVHSEDTHGNPPARFPPALQLLPTDPADDKVYIHNAAPPALRCSLPAHLTETKLPPLHSSPSPLVPTSTQNPCFLFPSPAPRRCCPLPSLSLSIWQHALALPTLLPSPLFFLHTTYALPLRYAFSH